MLDAGQAAGAASYSIRKPILPGVDGGVEGGEVVAGVVIEPAGIGAHQEAVALERASVVAGGGLAGGPGVVAGGVVDPVEGPVAAVEAYPEIVEALSPGQGGDGLQLGGVVNDGEVAAHLTRALLGLVQL